MLGRDAPRASTHGSRYFVPLPRTLNNLLAGSVEVYLSALPHEADVPDSRRPAPGSVRYAGADVSTAPSGVGRSAAPQPTPEDGRRL